MCWSKVKTTRICLCFYYYGLHMFWIIFLPLGPLTSLISMILSVRLLLRRIHSRTRPPASFSASTAPLWVTSLTSVSFTRTIQSFTLHSKVTYSKTNDTCHLLYVCPFPDSCFVLYLFFVLYIRDHGQKYRYRFSY